MRREGGEVSAEDFAEPADHRQVGHGRLCRDVEGATPAGNLRLTALLIGLAWVVFLSFAAPYTDLFLVNSELSGNHLPLGPVSVLLVLLLLRSAWQRWGRRTFGSAQLLFIFCMTLVAAGIPTFGLAAYLLPAMVAPSYLATPENQYAATLLKHVPSFLVPQDPVAIRGFFEGLRGGSPIPWGCWLKPLLLWSVFVLALYALMTSLSVLIAPQWIHNERLTFPLAELPVQLAEDSLGSIESRGRQSPLFWWGVALPVALHSFNALHFYNPAVPLVPLREIPFGNALVFRPWNHFQGFIYVYFSVIGLAYLLPAEVSFSLWFFYFFNRLVSVAADALGYDAPYTAIAESQFIGAFIMFVLLGLRPALPRLRRALRPRQPGDREGPAGEMMTVRSALFLGGASIAVLLIWCGVAGLALPVGLAIVALFIVVCFGLGRIVSETGVLFAKATQMQPLKVLLPIAGARSFGLTDIPMVGLLSYVFMFDLKTFLMPALLHSHKIADRGGLNRKHLLGSIAASLTLAVVSSYVGVLLLAYRHSGLKMSSWFFIYGPAGACDYINSCMVNPLGPEPGKAAAMIAGALFAAFLQFMRLRFLWWPFHPVGYVLAYSYETMRVWFAFLIGWLGKVLTVRYGGLRSYRKGLPFFLGLMVGEFGVAAFWLVVDASLGKAGHRVFP